MTQSSSYTIGAHGEHEFKASDGTRALIILTVRVEYDPEFNFIIDPDFAEVFPCVGGGFGHIAYAMKSLQGEVLRQWIEQHHDDLVDLALKLKYDEEDAYELRVKA